jgi:hypothetical protein
MAQGYLLVHEVVDKAVVKVLTTKMGVTGSGLDLEDTLLNGQQGHIEGTATKIENEDIARKKSVAVQEFSW